MNEYFETAKLMNNTFVSEWEYQGITEGELGFILPIPSLCNFELFSIYLAIGNEKLGKCLENMHGSSF